jgi:hypothetical protein
VEDLVLVDQGLVAVVWRRKTDQERRDLDLVAVPYLPQPATCPVRAWLAWQEAAGLTSGPAFRPVHPRARLNSPEAPAIRAQLQAAPRLRDEKVSLALKRLAGRAGLADPDRYSSHSTRRGFAAELRRHGASDLEIAAARRVAAPGPGAPLRHVGRHLARSPGRPARAVAMVTVTDFDEHREVRADRVLELARRERPSWREFRQAALDLDPDRQEEAADDLLAAGRW